MTPEKLREAAKVLKEMHRVAGPRNYTNTFDSEEIVTVFEAADACTMLAAQMERAEQTFEKWFYTVNEQYYYRRVTLDIHNREPWRELARNAWHAAQAAMQAKLDKLTNKLHQNADEAVKDMETIQAKLDAALAERDAYKLQAATYRECPEGHKYFGGFSCPWCIIESIEKDVAATIEHLGLQIRPDQHLTQQNIGTIISSLKAERDAANERVKELEAKITSLPHYDNCEKWVKADACDGNEYIIEETRKCTCELER